MRPNGESNKALLIDHIADLARASGKDLDPHFVPELFRNVPAEDLRARNEDDLLGLAANLWSFLRERRRGHPKLRVLDPRLPGHEWCGGHTVVQIVNDDMPFLVDSLTMALNARDLLVHLLIHPVLSVERAPSGQLLGLAPEGRAGARESLMQIEIAGVVDEETAQAMAQDLEAVLGDVRSAVVDWPLMVGRAERLAPEVTLSPIHATDAAEAAAFLAWLNDGNFTFLGYRDYEITGEAISIIPGSGLGLLRDDNYLVFDGLRSRLVLSTALAKFIESPEILVISKTSRVSTVHRRAPMDTVSVKHLDSSGVVIGQRLFIGLFTSKAYMQPLSAIPMLRRKVQRVIERSGFAPSGHDGKALQHILDSFPRDELLQTGEDELLETTIGIVNLQERQRIALFLRRDAFGRFVSCLVYVPRDRYSHAVRRRMGEILMEAFSGSLLTEATHFDESVLARIHFIVSTHPDLPPVDTAALEERLVEAGRTWTDRLSDALAQARDAHTADRLVRRYREAFPTSYSEATEPAAAVGDVARMEAILGGSPFELLMQSDGVGGLMLRTFRMGEPLALSDALPTLENFGLRVITEIPFETKPADTTRPMWIQEFRLLPKGSAVLDSEAPRRFEEAFTRVRAGRIEDDGLNRLVMLAQLSGRQATILRCYCKIFRQAGSTFSQAYMEDTLAAHPDLARLLVLLFEAQFALDTDEAERAAEAERIAASIAEGLEAVSSLDEDRILRGFLLLIRQSLRTNYHQRAADGTHKPYLSIKLASREIELLPLPRPWVEVYVYSPQVEGCHLRGGPVARGGLRWSDRKEDFRTEILGLMKAQMVKNAVIVPVGSKGGFVVKRPPGDADAMRKEVVACYRTFISGLLDITDNIVGGAVVPAPDVVRRDGDDPYLVVAADKGTATFSDLANSIAKEYGFWLDDAFASGGSVGYDHKVMGITSRGAWEAVKRHFRELGRDIQTTDFNCIGIGDMSGDVFGNGMLLSHHTRLIAAFNHQHIFLDPDPDMEASWQERNRLFQLPRSGWNDYDTGMISAGGGVFARAAKSLTLSPQTQARFGLASATITPAELIRALLRLPVDLLWFGGIGTYVKAGAESQTDANDRANDALRVNGSELKALVIGEGANLAMTQRGRIEAALRGVRLNTDAIDNSAGVDASDHEVNIKIGVGALIEAGHLEAAQRPAFLASLTEQVGELVLSDNYHQTLALSLTQAEARERLDDHARLMRVLEREGRLNRAVEFLPNEEELSRRSSMQAGLTRPELAVLLAYAKMALYDQLLESDLPGEAVLEPDFIAYFPPSMASLAPEDLGRHRLRREIVGTIVANAIINRMGPSFAVDMQARTGRHAADLARSWLVVSDAFELPALWREIEGLDGKVPADAQLSLFLRVQHVAAHACRWLLQSGLSLDIAARRAELSTGLRALERSLSDVLPPAEQTAHERARDLLVEQGIPAGVAERVVALQSLGNALDIVGMLGGGALDVASLARLYFLVGARLGILALRRLAAELASGTPWQRMATSAVADDLAMLQRDILRRVMEQEGSTEGALDKWIAARQDSIDKLQEMLVEMRRTQPVDLAMLVVAVRQLRTLMAS